VVVVDALGAVLTGAEVRILSADRGEVLTAMYTDKNGRAAAALPPGEYDLSVTVSAFRSAATRISVTMKTPQTITIRLYPTEKEGGSPDVSLAPETGSAQTLRILGQVVDKSGARVPKARVLLIDLNALEIQRTSSDDKGEFEFKGLNLTPYEIKAACQGFVTGSAKILELVDRGTVITPSPPPSLTLNVKITLAVKSAP
jgi:hypothetical protein